MKVSVIMGILAIPLLLSSIMSGRNDSSDDKLGEVIPYGWDDVSWEITLKPNNPTVNVSSFVEALPDNSCGGFKFPPAKVTVWGCKGVYDHRYEFTTNVIRRKK